MFFYTLIVPTIVLGIVKLFKMRKMQKHDKVLFRFCQIRRDVMVILREKGLGMTKETFQPYKTLLDSVNDTIHYYDDLKTSLFDLRKFLSYLKEVQRAAKELEKIETPVDEELKQLYRDFVFAWFKAFYAYTPFIKYTAGFWLIAILAKIIGRGYRHTLSGLIATLRNISEKFDVPVEIARPIAAASS